MGDDLSAANVNRSYQLAASCIAIFTFLLFFLYPRFASGQVDALRFQATLIVIGVATFSFAFASFYYYGASLGGWIDPAERAKYSSRGDRFWLLGSVLLFLAPSLILFTVRLPCRRVCMVRTLAGVRAFCDPLLREGPECGEELRLGAVDSQLLC